MIPYKRFLFLSEDYPENWDELRKAVYRRDGWQCQKCGVKNTQLHAHHQTPLSMGGSNDINNLITLCNNCHIDNHPHLWWGRWKENNPQTILALRILVIALSISILITSDFDWRKVLVLIFVFRFLF